MPGVPGETTQHDINPVVVEEEQMGWVMNYGGVTTTPGGVTAPLWCFKRRPPAPKGVVLKSASERAYGPRKFVPSWRQIDEFPGMGGGAGEQRVVDRRDNHKVCKVSVDNIPSE